MSGKEASEEEIRAVEMEMGLESLPLDDDVGRLPARPVLILRPISLSTLAGIALAAWGGYGLAVGSGWGIVVRFAAAVLLVSVVVERHRGSRSQD